ncbi:MAG: hypothetical protein ACRDNB_01140 [Gaiellaceae bacterium]
MHAAPTRYLVEIRRQLVLRDVQTIGDRSRRAAGELRSEGTAVRFLRTIVVPEDDACYLLFEAGSARDVEEAVRRSSSGPAVVTEVLSAELEGEGRL